MIPPRLASILSHWLGHLPVDRVEPWVGRGLSGARIWRVSAGGAPYALRQWNAERSLAERLETIRRVLEVVERAGWPPVALPLAARDGRWLVEQEGRLWQLEPWMPGAPSPEGIPDRARVEAALGALAAFHRTAATLGTRLGMSPGLERRRDEAADLAARRTDYRAALARSARHPLVDAARTILELAMERQAEIHRHLQRAALRPVPLQWCIRDIWRDHVLFTGNRVSGLIDFAGMGEETPAADIARLAGTLVEDEPLGWQWALDAYQALRPLAPEEASLVSLFDQANTVLGGILWIRWLFEEHRRFPSREGVAERLAYFRRRLAARPPG